MRSASAWPVSGLRVELDRRFDEPGDRARVPATARAMRQTLHNLDQRLDPIQRALTQPRPRSRE